MTHTGPTALSSKALGRLSMSRDPSFLASFKMWLRRAVIAAQWRYRQTLIFGGIAQSVALRCIAVSSALTLSPRHDSSV